MDEKIRTSALEINNISNAIVSGLHNEDILEAIDQVELNCQIIKTRQKLNNHYAAKRNSFKLIKPGQNA